MPGGVDTVFVPPPLPKPFAARVFCAPFPPPKAINAIVLPDAIYEFPPGVATPESLPEPPPPATTVYTLLGIK